jgi:hypothetical protein
MADEWYTPKSLFDDLGLKFDLDVASPIHSKIHVPAEHRYTINDNGLESPWFGRVWMNPPYSKPKPWVIKWLNHGNGIALLPMAKSQWFNDLINSNANFTVLPYSFKFENVNNQKIQHMMASTLWALGESNIEAISRMGKVR